jgi:hypothetical protein
MTYTEAMMGPNSEKWLGITPGNIETSVGQWPIEVNPMPTKKAFFHRFRANFRRPVTYGNFQTKVS